MTTTIESTKSQGNDEQLLRDLVRMLVLETVGESVDRGLTTVQGGELALKRLISRGWDKTWMRLFGPSALAAQWRDANEKRQDKFYEALPETPPEPVVEVEVRPTDQMMSPASMLSASPTAIEQPEEEAIVQLAEEAVSPDVIVPAPQSAIHPVRHGRDDSLSRLSRDQLEMLGTRLTVAGLWTYAGELQRPDVRTVRSENRQRMRSNIAGYRSRDAKLAVLETYYDNDAVNLNALVATGRISIDQLREFKDALS